MVGLLYPDRFWKKSFHFTIQIPIIRLSIRPDSHPHVVAQGYLGVALLCLGFPDQALAHTNAAIVEARRLAHSPTLASGLVIGAIQLSVLDDTRVLNELVNELVEVAAEQGYPQWRALGAIYRGWVKAKNGNVVEGISLLRGDSVAYRANGSEVWTAHHTALLSRAYDIAEQIEEALTALDDALQIARRTGELSAARWAGCRPTSHRKSAAMHRNAEKQVILRRIKL